MEHTISIVYRKVKFVTYPRTYKHRYPIFFKWKKNHCPLLPWILNDKGGKWTQNNGQKKKKGSGNETFVGAQKICYFS